MTPEHLQIALTLGTVLFLFLGSGVWIALSLLGVGWVGLTFFGAVPVEKAMATSIWQASASWTLAALPLFIWMGEILFRAGLSEILFRGIAPWITWLPGRLMHVNVLGCGLFAAVCGSSAATVATIGRMSLPELEKRGYNRTLSVGSLAAMIRADSVPEETQRMSLREKIARSGELLPVVLLIISVIGSIYMGIATATEAAAGGVIGALILSAWTRTLNRPMFFESLLSATRLSCMIFFILAGAAFLTTSLAYTGLPKALAGWIGGMELNPYTLIVALCLLYLVLGCFIEGISMIVLTATVVLPLVSQAGFDLIWFGIFIIIVVEIAQITPPLGFNLFVIQGLTGMGIFKVAAAAIPFFLLLITAAVLLTIFPEIATWLPSTMSSG